MDDVDWARLQFAMTSIYRRITAPT